VDDQLNKAVIKDTSSAAISHRIKEPNWIVRHWRGDLSLPVSYWVIGFLLNITIGVAMGVFAQTAPMMDMPPRTSGAAIFAVFFLVALFTIWQIVGTWRSAAKHTSRGGSAFWAGAARLALILGALKGIVEYQKQFPLIKESAYLALGIDRIPPHEIRILADGRELELSGGIDWGTTDEVAAELAKNTNVAIIHLNSIGGRINEAQSLHDLIKSKNLATYTSSECASACTLAYLAGRERYIGEKGRIGFHSSAIVGDDKPFELLNDEMAALYRSHGLSDAFINKALAVDPKSMWYPSHDELLTANVVSAIVDSRYYGMSGVKDWADAFKIEQGLLELDAFAVLKENDPATYGQMKTIFVNGIKAGRPLFDITQDVRAIFMAQVVPKYLKTAPDKELLEYWRQQMAEARYIANLSADDCVAFLGIRRPVKPFDIQKALPDDMIKQDLTLLANLMRGAIRSPQTPGNVEQYGETFATIIMKMAAIDPEYMNVLKDMDRYQGPNEKLCAATMALYDLILDLPPEKEPGSLIRAMMNGI
jgi:hypothetical protein